MLKKLLLPTLLVSTLSVSAAEDDCCPDVQMNCCPELQMNCLPRYENSLFIETAFLYWVAKQEGNDYATTGNAITVPGTADPNTGLTPELLTSSGQVYAPNTNIEPGFKVGLGINLEHGQWDLFSEYTYLFSKGDGSVSSSNLNAGILPLFSYTPNNSILLTTTSANSTTATNFVSSANSSWSLHFNTVSLELRRLWEPFCYLSLRPHFGFQGTWQEQHFNANYDISSFTTFLPAGNNQVQFKQNSWGVGARFGLDGVWKFSRHFGLFIDSAFAALWGQFTARGRSYDTNTAAGYSNVLISDQRLNIYTVIPVIEALIGLQADWSFSDTYLLIAQAGWEEQVWFFQNQHSTLLSDSSLVLQGFTAKLQVDF
jgi:hypothetical protein